MKRNWSMDDLVAVHYHTLGTASVSDDSVIVLHKTEIQDWLEEKNRHSQLEYRISGTQTLEEHLGQQRAEIRAMKAVIQDLSPSVLNMIDKIMRFDWNLKPYREHLFKPEVSASVVNAGPPKPLPRRAKR